MAPFFVSWWPHDCVSGPVGPIPPDPGAVTPCPAIGAWAEIESTQSCGHKARVDLASPGGANSFQRFRALLQRWKDSAARPESRTIFGHPSDGSPTTAAEPCCGPEIAHGRVSRETSSPRGRGRAVARLSRWRPIPLPVRRLTWSIDPLEGGPVLHSAPVAVQATPATPVRRTARWRRHNFRWCQATAGYSVSCRGKKPGFRQASGSGQAVPR